MTSPVFNVFAPPAAVSSTCYDITGASLVVGPSPLQAPSSGTLYQLTFATRRWVLAPLSRLWILIFSRSTSDTSALGALALLRYINPQLTFDIYPIVPFTMTWVTLNLDFKVTINAIDVLCAHDLFAIAKFLLKVCWCCLPKIITVSPCLSKLQCWRVFFGDTMHYRSRDYRVKRRNGVIWCTAHVRKTQTKCTGPKPTTASALLRL